MSRFKMYGLFTALIAGIMGNKKMSTDEKQKQTSDINRQAGGMMFSTGPIPSRLPNQRQRRKQARQSGIYK